MGRALTQLWQQLWQWLSSDSNSDSSSVSRSDNSWALTATLTVALTAADLWKQLWPQLWQQLWQDLWQRLSSDSNSTALTATALSRTVTHQSTMTLSIWSSFIACASGSLAPSGSVWVMLLNSASTWLNSSTYWMSKSWTACLTVLPRDRLSGALIVIGMIPSSELSWPSGIPSLSSVPSHSSCLRWAMFPNAWFGSGSRLEQNWNCCNRLYPINTPNCTEPACCWPVTQCYKPRTLTSTKYLCSHRITIWYICQSCSSPCSFTSCSPICNPISIRWVSAKNTQCSALCHCDSTNIDLITNGRPDAQRAWNTGSFTHISYCDGIRTQLLNQSQSSEFAKMGLWCM